MFAELRVELRNPKTRYFFVFGLCVMFEFEDELFPFTVVEGDVDIVRLQTHDLNKPASTLSRTQPPATLMTVVSPRACL